ncbi:uncharacterized protein LOC124272279 [Haliotis rubra]|uniref:uncharacterized protein LOC124272279 n=1 Tax=Haliotis rubra TaxID=36100 RepID=UPI001EE572D1|nr:uncharacterized protein LOC124272279 [Haliotis rubra]
MPTKERIKRKREEAVKVEARKCRRLIDFFAPNRPDLDESEVVSYENSRAHETESVNPTQNKDGGHKTAFDTKWQQNRPWSRYSEDYKKKGMMFCSLCSKWNTKGRNGLNVDQTQIEWSQVKELDTSSPSTILKTQASTWKLESKHCSITVHSCNCDCQLLKLRECSQE